MTILLQYRNLILGMIIIFVFVVIARNVHSHYSQQLGEVAKQRQVLEKGKKTLEEWARLQGEYNQVSAKLIKEDVLALKKFIEQKAQAAGMRIESLNFSQADEGFYWQVTIRISAASAYKNFAKFMDSLKEKTIQAEQIRVVGARETVKMDLNLKGVIVK